MHARIQVIRRHPRAWACLVVYGGILVEVALIGPFSTTTRALLLGYLAVSILACVGWLVHETSGSRRWGNTRLGEEATHEAVVTWRRRSTDWQVVRGIPHEGDSDTGHVLVGPGGVYAIESTWTPDEFELDHGAVVGLHGREPVAQAQASARSVQQLLRDSPEHLDVTVHPVVVVWGPGGPHLDDGWTDVDGTLVCRGARDAAWLEHMEGTELDRRSVDRITDVLANQGRRSTDHRRRRTDQGRPTDERLDDGTGRPAQALGA
jgi:hypothetical protein